VVLPLLVSSFVRIANLQYISFVDDLRLMMITPLYTRRVTVMLSDTNIISLEIVFDTSRRTYPVIYCSNIHVKQHKPIDKRYSLLFLVIMGTSTLTKREEKLSEKVSDKTEVDVIKIIYIIILIIKLVVGYS
jgi:hypothetical protein